MSPIFSGFNNLIVHVLLQKEGGGGMVGGRKGEREREREREREKERIWYSHYHLCIVHRSTFTAKPLYMYKTCLYIVHSFDARDDQLLYVYVHVIAYHMHS